LSVPVKCGKDADSLISKAHLTTIKNSIVSPSISPGHNPDHVLSLLDLLIILFERKRLILGVTALAAGLALMISLLLPPRYTATVTLPPPRQRPSDSGELGRQGDLPGGSPASFGSRFASGNSNYLLVALLTSRAVEDSMIRRFDLEKEYHAHTLSEARKKFERHFTVDGDTISRMIYISVEDRDAQRAAELANGYVDEYRQFSQRLYTDEAMHRRVFF
jgi:tyrosine-protein kinase Etk/Wzc